MGIQGGQAVNIIDQIADERDKAQQENKLLKQRIKRLESVTNDPHALWANWLRGSVALPVGIGDVRQYQERIKRLEEAGDELTESSHSADDDIREHLQVANYNLHGLLNTGERITPPNQPKTVHQAGIDASVRVREKLRAARLAWKAAKEAKP
jgi:cell division septum initiation protein DivIVA